MQKYILILICLSSFIIHLSCDLVMNSGKDKFPYDEDLSNLVIYAYEIYSDTLAVVDLVTAKVLRRITTFDGIQSVVTNRSGSRLYVSTGKGHAGINPGAIYEVNTRTWSYREIYNNAAHLLSNRNGGIYFITKIDTGPVRIFGSIDPDRGSVRELGTIDVQWRSHLDDDAIEIHPHKPEIYAINGDRILYRFNYETKTLTNMFRLDVPSMTLSWGGDTLYIPGGPVLDMLNEEIVGSIPVWWLGRLAVRRDNKEAYITDPGSMLIGPQPSGKIFVYSTAEDRIIDEIEMKIIDGEIVPTDRIFLSPEERYAIVNDGMFSYLIIDLERRDVVFSHRFVKNNVRTLSLEGFYLAPKPP
jgi:DNA-binding beta-propeller fold protein YncE